MTEEKMRKRDKIAVAYKQFKDAVRSEDRELWKAAEKLQQSEYPNETVSYVYDKLRAFQKGID